MRSRFSRVDERSSRSRPCASAKNVEQHERRRGCRRRSSSTSLAEPDDLGEDDVDDAEEQRTAAPAPHVAEHGAVEAQLEVGDRERPGAAPEAPGAAVPMIDVPRCGCSTARSSRAPMLDVGAAARRSPPVGATPCTISTTRCPRAGRAASPPPWRATDGRQRGSGPGASQVRRTRSAHASPSRRPRTCPVSASSTASSVAKHRSGAARCAGGRANSGFVDVARGSAPRTHMSQRLALRRARATRSPSRPRTRRRRSRRMPVAVAARVARRAPSARRQAAEVQLVVARADRRAARRSTTTRPRSSSIARSQKRSTGAHVVGDERIVLPSRLEPLELARSTSAGTRRRRPRAPRRPAACRRRPGSPPRTRAARSCPTSSS